MRYKLIEGIALLQLTRREEAGQAFSLFYAWIMFAAIFVAAQSDFTFFVLLSLSVRGCRSNLESLFRSSACFFPVANFYIDTYSANVRGGHAFLLLARHALL